MFKATEYYVLGLLWLLKDGADGGDGNVGMCD
ncbi:hypothetical protein ANO14919_063650 [Xylariales sp. No.14919]|nr:hypothetical protein ANO14919_063650 [Xylariales sp. No.14919]